VQVNDCCGGEAKEVSSDSHNPRVAVIFMAQTMNAPRGDEREECRSCSRILTTATSRLLLIIATLGGSSSGSSGSSCASVSSGSKLILRRYMIC
jgi:hypothetical protein